MEQVIQCLSAFLGCLGFAFVFRVHRRLPYALLASLGGMLGWIVYFYCCWLFPHCPWERNLSNNALFDFT